MPFHLRELQSVALAEEKCPTVSAALAEVLKVRKIVFPGCFRTLVQEKVGLSASRGYIQLTDPTAARVGWSF